jgi:DNA (cytosine-5)-methyltransferase 1
MPRAYYNEHDAYAAQWLRNLIAGGHIAPGIVDERDILDVEPKDLKGFTQCHFFAGIGVWSYALRLAGWPDTREVWTGSCPCQPFSEIGKGKGLADERHLWPAFYHLITQRKPRVVFGEQVASADGLAWLDVVLADMEAARYAFAALDLCAAGFGAPHIRQRLYWLGHAERTRLEGHTGHGDRATGWPVARRSIATSSILGDGKETGGFWHNADWLFCRDDRWRAVEPGSFPLADGVASRVGRVRAYGNAVVASQAAEFVAAYLNMENAA